MEFIIKENSGTGLKEIFKEVKSLFGKTKLKKVSPDEYYRYSRDYLLSSKGNYSICPKLKGSNMLEYLTEKSNYNNQHFTSDFNCRTIWKLNIKNEQIIGFGPLQIKNFSGTMEVRTEDGTLVFSPMDIQFSLPVNSTIMASTRILELLLQNACNGIYQNARDVEEYNIQVRKDCNLPLDTPLYVCEECGETFANLDEFFCHLIKEAHFDSILTSHPFDKEVLRVKKLVEENRQKA